MAFRTRHLPATAAHKSAEDLAALITSLPTGRLLERLDSLVLLADAEADEAERSAQLRLRFAHFNRTDQRGLSGLYARLSSADAVTGDRQRSEEHTSEIQSLMSISYAVFCLKKKTEQP